jgi:hypothetical protein
MPMVRMSIGYETFFLTPRTAARVLELLTDAPNVVYDNGWSVTRTKPRIELEVVYDWHIAKKATKPDGPAELNIAKVEADLASMTNEGSEKALRETRAKLPNAEPGFADFAGETPDEPTETI